MSKKILLIDDDKDILDAYKEILEECGYLVIFATDGEEGLQYANKEKFDLILLDIMIPKTDGIKLLEEIQQTQINKSTPVIMLTNFGQEDLIKKSLALGAVDFLLKYNLTPGEVVVKVNQFLAEKPIS